MFKPQHTLLFLILVGACCALIMYFFPVGGIKINDEFSLKFASWEDFNDTDTIEAINVEELLASYEEPFDSASFKDSIKLYEYEVAQAKLRIHYPNSGPQLEKFFSSLLNDAGNKKVRVLHYGDSQIEGDRISSYFRNKFQEDFGGRGPGYVPPINQVPNMSLAQSNSDNWHRYTVFGKKDTTVKHKNFGAFGVFGRYAPYIQDSVLEDTVKAWVQYETSYLGYSGTRTYHSVKMIYGNCSKPFTLRVYVGEELYDEQVLFSEGTNATVNWSFNKTPKLLRFEFEGVSSPDIYGFMFENGAGVYVDNIAMRGSSGTIFNRIGRSQLSAQYKDLDAKLILLQYGGNTVPYIDSKEEAIRYGNWMSSQIKTVKRLNPHADIILIGPSDMATKVKTDYVTFPFLEEVRDVLKNAAFENNCGFWDIYEVMGGQNSMKSWVNAEPALAAKDYVHFTHRGAKHVASLFYDALIKDFEEYKAHLERLKFKEDSVKAYKQSLLNDTLVNDSAQPAS